ncbi:MAG: hypothetical protein B7C24_17445 [Bacteroidetes bacterium 4572_77]|nr:MAG: hypothetical protein B7C24_17445 [Bacteroidetes bacterium 4572_77]
MIISDISFRDEDGDYLNFGDVDKNRMRIDINENEAVYFSLGQLERILAKLGEIKEQNSVEK